VRDVSAADVVFRRPSSSAVAGELRRRQERRPRADGWLGRAARYRRTPQAYLLAAFLAFLALAAPGQGLRRATVHVALAVGAAGAVEVAAHRRRAGAWRFPRGAVLTGLIVAFVLSTSEPWYVPAAAGAVAVGSKYVLRTGRGQVFNSAALALVAAVLAFGSGESWWGALGDLPWPWVAALLVAGVVVVDRVNKFPLALSFAGTYFALFAAAAWVAPARVVEMFHEPFVNAALFLAAFMLTDPPTAPAKPRDQVWVGVLVGAVAWAAQLLGAGQTYLLLGCLAGNAALAGRRSLSIWTSGFSRRADEADVRLRPVSRVIDASGREVLRRNV
jgi:Na+-translocating ferredoxin:NAD+ oxidoreductase RnfD subunit